MIREVGSDALRGITAAIRMIAQRQREISVSLAALRMMQAHHGNRYFTFDCVSRAEAAEWRSRAEEATAPLADFIAKEEARMAALKV